MAKALFSLDSPRPLSPATRLGQSAGMALYFVVVGLAFANAEVMLVEVPSFALSTALIGAFVCAVTALLMISHARATGRRGYLWIAMTFLYMAGVLASYPLFFPGAIVGQGALIGNGQSAITVYLTWHLAFPIGLSIATWMLYSDTAKHRRPSLTTGQMWAGMAAVVIGLVITLALVAVVPEGQLPLVANGDGSKSGVAHVADLVVLALSIVFFGVALYCARTGSVISRWLAAMATLAVGEAIVNLGAVERYSVGWYFGRLLWLIAVSVLLVSLIWNLSRVDRANNQLATVDSLTGADSRLAFLSNVHREIARAQDRGSQVAMLWIDLDGFKAINDQLGHQLGDDVLRRVVDRLGQQVRLTDHVGRLGGDEFGVLLCDYETRDQVHSVAQRLASAVREPIRLGETQLHVTAAIGIAAAPSDAQNAEELLQCADLAMYAVKEAGGDAYLDFTPTMGTEAMARARMRQALADAVRQRQFIVHYQPIHEADGLRIAGVEALVRWERGGQVLSAGEFIPFAEESGQIVPVGRIVIDRLADDLPRWVDAYDDDFFVCVNLSVKELSDRALVESLVSGPLGVYATRVVLEVTESLELQESSEAGENLQRVRDAGFRVAIDDFGAGFSNFTRLERLRPSLLKIDRSLVKRAGSEVEGGVAFLSAATSVAASLNCDVVAEGVQTQAEAQVVALLGVRYVQGFRYARPGPIEQYVESASADI